MKYVLLVSLTLLCVVAMSCGASAADGWTPTWANPQANLPTSLVWDQSFLSVVKATNSGDTTWDTNYAMTSVQGIDAAASPLDRWGLTANSTLGTVAPTKTQTYRFYVVAPPVSSLAYTAPVTPTAAGAIVPFDDNWMIANASTLVTTATAEAGTKVLRFSDTGSGDALHTWAAFQVEELAGHVPAITTGYPDGTFRPTANVSRDQMAVFLYRALQLPTAPLAGSFTDVPSGFWAEKEIEALVKSGITTGYPDKTFRPLVVVNRGQMAVFVARGLCGGESNVPVIPTAGATALFSDIPVGFWAYNHIAYCVKDDVVKGYPDGTFKPLGNVDRGTMAVFLYRAFIQKSDATVVLGGAAVTAQDPTATNYIGWTNFQSGAPGTALNAYIVLDAARLGPTLAGSGTLDVTFKVTDSSGTVVQTKTASLSASDLSTAHDVAAASGNPYRVVSAALDPIMTSGRYTVSASITDAIVTDGAVGRTQTFGIGTPTSLGTEGFESGTLPTGWVVTALNGSTQQAVVTTLTGGYEPTCASSHVPSPTTAPDGSYALCSWPNADNSAQAGGTTADSQVTTASYDCSGLYAVSLNFVGACGTNTGNGGGTKIEVSGDGGTTWHQVMANEWTMGRCSGNWANFSYDISKYAALQSNVKVRWTYTGSCCYGWVIDDMSINGLQ